MPDSPSPDEGVDRSQMRELLRLTPEQRLELLQQDVAGLMRLERDRKVEPLTDAEAAEMRNSGWDGDLSELRGQRGASEPGGGRE